jgi:hypothetical protein
MVARSFPIKIFEPQDTERWEKEYEKAEKWF